MISAIGARVSASPDAERGVIRNGLRPRDDARDKAEKLVIAELLARRLSEGRAG